MDDSHPIGWESRVGAIDAIGDEPAHDLDDGRTSPAGRPRCGAATDLDTAEIATLTALPNAVDPVLRHVVCELGSGHEGSHVAFAVAVDNGERWWWLRWHGKVRAVVQIDVCEATWPGRPRDECLLPASHPGPHSFDIRAPTT